MKSLLSVIRWKFVGPVVLVMSAVVVFFVVFLDPFLARILESSLSAVNQAKVDVSGLKTKIFQGRLTIARIQVTDRSDVMRNIVEGGPLVFELNLGQLAKKKVIIPEASFSGLQFETVRKRSGALRRKPKPKKSDEGPSVTEAFVKKIKDRSTFTLDGLKDQAKSKIEFNVDELEVVKQANEIKELYQRAPGAWEQKFETLRVEERLKHIESQLKQIKATPTTGNEALLALPESLKKLEQTKAEVDRLKADFKTAQNDLKSEVDQFKSQISSLKEAKKNDVDNLMSRLNLDFANPKKIAESMLGPVLLDRLTSTLHYIQLVRKHMPSKQEQQTFAPKPRAMGLDIPFPTPAALPRFWLEKAALSGEYKGVNASGQLTDVTSNPVRIGKPTILTLKGDHEDKTFMFRGLVDQVSQTTKSGFDFSASHIPLVELLTSGFLSQAVTGGNGQLQLNVLIDGDDQLTGHIKIIITHLALSLEALNKKFGVSDSRSPENALKSKFISEIAAGLKNMPSISATAQLSGTLGSPDFSFDSNLIAQMDNVIKSTIGAMVSDQKKELEARLNQILAQQQQELTTKLGSLQTQLDQSVRGFDSKIQAKVNEIAGINLDGVGPKGLPKIKIPSLDKLFK